MKLLFISNQPIRFTAETPLKEPLGGTESCTAYLAAQLAANGHDVTLAVVLPEGAPERVLGVRHRGVFAITAEFFAAEDFDAIIAVGAPDLAAQLKAAAPRAVQAAWLHALPDQPGMAALPAATPHLDAAVFVSESQRRAVDHAGRALVIGNGIAPVFETMFGSAEELAAAKQNRAAYASTPFRGLNVLRQAFSEARLATELDIYGGMRLYQQDEAQMAGLYDAVRATPRCHLHGAVAQPELARRLRAAAFLFYPCTYAETYCITALEAMAAGLKVVSTELGALQETTLGFADLLPLPPGPIDLMALAKRFVAPMEKTEAEFLADPQAWAQERFAQSQAVSRLCNWRVRAKEWEAFLGPAVAAKRGA